MYFKFLACRPVNNFSETLTVKLGLRLSQLIDVVIHNNIVTIRTSLGQTLATQRCDSTQTQRQTQYNIKIKTNTYGQRHRDKVMLGSIYGFKAAQFKYNYF